MSADAPAPAVLVHRRHALAGLPDLPGSPSLRGRALPPCHGVLLGRSAGRARRRGHRATCRGEASTRWCPPTMVRRCANAAGSSPFPTPCWTCVRRTARSSSAPRRRWDPPRARRAHGVMPVRRPVIGVMGGSASAPRRSRPPIASAASPPRRDGWCSREGVPPESWRRRPSGPSRCRAASRSASSRADPRGRWARQWISPCSPVSAKRET